MNRHAPFPALVLALALVRPTGLAHAANFTVIDAKADEEISEVSRLYIDGTLVGTFRLNDATRQISLPITVADPPGSNNPPHDYALCGEVTIRNQAGAAETHEVSAQGVLRDPQGRVFAALGARDFTMFFLADPTDPAAVQIHPGHSPFCQAPVS